MKKTKMSNKQLSAILKEHFQAYVLLGFTMEGKAVRYCDYETDVQAHAIGNALRSEANQNCQAPEVWVRNLEGDD